MDVVELKKAKREIRLDDSPDSPVYTLNFTDKGIEKTCAALAHCYQQLSGVASGVVEKLSPVALAEAYREVISAAMGEGVYWEIIAYLDGDPEDVNILLTPLIEYLFSEYGSYVETRREKLREKYVDKPSS